MYYRQQQQQHAQSSQPLQLQRFTEQRNKRVAQGTSSRFSTRQNGGVMVRNPGTSHSQRRGYGLGHYVERGGGFRKATNPLVTDNKANIEKWEPRVMSPSEMITSVVHCLEVSDAFIRLDTHMDMEKKFNPSNHELLRMQRLHNKAMGNNSPEIYRELIVECLANPNKFEGTFHCLKLAIGDGRLREYIREQRWTKDYLNQWRKDYDIAADWMFDSDVLSAEKPNSHSQFSAMGVQNMEESKSKHIPAYSSDVF